MNNTVNDDYVDNNSNDISSTITKNKTKPASQITTSTPSSVTTPANQSTVTKDVSDNIEASNLSGSVSQATTNPVI